MNRDAIERESKEQTMRKILICALCAPFVVPAYLVFLGLVVLARIYPQIVED